MVDPDRVEDIVQVLLLGLEGCADESSLAEILSAVFTITARLITRTTVHHPEYRCPYLRDAAQTLLMHCQDSRDLAN